jgi:hypothetical protein
MGFLCGELVVSLALPVCHVAEAGKSRLLKSGGKPQAGNGAWNTHRLR